MGIYWKGIGMGNEMTQTIDLEQLFYWGLGIDGDHHKQWCLHQAAQLLIVILCFGV